MTQCIPVTLPETLPDHRRLVQRCQTQGIDREDDPILGPDDKRLGRKVFSSESTGETGGSTGETAGHAAEQWYQ